MKNTEKEPTYYVSLTEYNEVKRMFLKANDEITKLKDLLNKWAQFEIEENPNDFTVMSERMSELANKTKEALK